MSEVTALQEKLAALETRLEKCQIQIAELKKKEKMQVFFSAEAGSRGAIGPYGSDTTLVYTNVINNVGNGYNSSSGVFYAPVAGVYYFTIFHHAGGSRGTELLLMCNGQRMVMSQNHPAVHESAHNGGNAVLLNLRQNDQVYVRMGANSHVYGSGYHTTFSGFLVY